ncbi:TonB-dependent receptor [Rapidithrix thailandica]|uniref:TonB-dependent receptor n=1 Tax=Rapidithrix thailandica TaxID=413964 RepID=A0AAW9SDC0_9BACT
MKFFKLIFLLNSLTGLFSHTMAQNLTVQGTVINQQTQTGIPDVSIHSNNSLLTVTDAQGFFQIHLEDKDNSPLTFQHLNYLPKSIVPNAPSDTLKVALSPKTYQLESVNITASRYLKRIMEEVVSVDLLSEQLIKDVNAITLTDALDKLPGTEVVDGQVAIRGGSNYSYGIGSRVQMVVDGQPLLTGDRNSIPWNFLPIEFADKVEVLKGAASTLYGSSALNGVIHLRTSWPDKKPETKLLTFYTAYSKPKRKEIAWWDRPPYQAGLLISHKQPFKRADLVVGGNYMKASGYLRNVDQSLKKVSAKFRLRPKQKHGLTWGFHGSIMESEEAEFIFWENKDEGAYIPFIGNNPQQENGLVRIDQRQYHIDPFLSVLTPKGDEHELKTRWYHVEFLNFTNNLQSDFFNTNYQFQTRLSEPFTLVTGASFQYFQVDDPDGFGNNHGNTLGLFGQLDYSGQRLNASAGMRIEHYKIAQKDSKTIPVFRGGINYQLATATHLRASFSQGFRMPSLAEMFVDKSKELVPIFPNPELKPEYGWNAELGIKRQVQIDQWDAYLDFALFLTDYHDMIEFQFGYHPPDTLDSVPTEDLIKYIGFKTGNVTRARIGGFEASVLGKGQVGMIPLRLSLGYSYNYPVDLNSDEELKNLGTYTGRFFKSMFNDSEEVHSPLLKYHHRSLAKADITASYKFLSIGLDYRYYGFVDKVDDAIIGAIPGAKEYREENARGNHTFHLRTGVDLKKLGKFTLIVRNLFNDEYVIRFAKMEAPRNFTLQYRVRL